MTHDAALDKSHRAYLFAGFASLFAAAFIDNARGPVLPVLCAQLKIPYETAGQFLMIGNIAAVLGTTAMGRLLPRFGDRRAAIVTSALAVAPGLLAPFVDGRLSLLLLGLILGMIISLVGSLSSILTMRGSPEARRSSYVSMQQVMYGIGSLIAPLTFSALIRSGFSWWWLFTGSSMVALVLSFIYARILPIESVETLTAPRKSAHSRWNAASVLTIFVFAFYVAGEVLASMWMSTLMVDRQHFLPEDAAQYQMGFFLLMGVTRFLCFLLVKPRYEAHVLLACLSLGIVFGILGQQGQSWALPLMGILGPFFPLTMASLSVKFPHSWKAMLIRVYVSIQLMLALMHVSVGRVADSLGIDKAFLLAPGFLLLSMLLLTAFLRIGQLRPTPAAQPMT